MMSMRAWSVAVLVAVSVTAACSSPAPSAGCVEGAVDSTQQCESECNGLVTHPVCHLGVSACPSVCDAGAGAPPDAGVAIADTGPRDPALIACGTMMCSGAATAYCLEQSRKDDAGNTSVTYQCTTIPVFCTPTPTCDCVLNYSACDVDPGATPACVAENGNVRVTCAQ